MRIEEDVRMIDNCTPLVSIVAPMYNVEKYIEAFIQCVIDQTYNNWELLLIDDGSTDTTIDIVKRFSDPRIRIFRRENRPKGANACRNIGIEKSKGKYIIIFDSDDMIEEICLSQRVQFMEENEDIEYATARGITVTEKDDGEIARLNKIWGAPSNKDILSRLLSTDYPFGVWNNIYRAKSIKDCKWDERLQIYQDFDFMVTIALHKKKHAYINQSQIDYLYREGRPNAITANYISESKFESTNYLFNKVQESIKDLDNSRQLHDQFERFYILQYERLITNGTVKQYKCFYKHIMDEYSDKLNLRIRLMNLFFGNNKSDGKMHNSTKAVFLAHLILFDQKRLLNIIYNKIVNKFGIMTF